MGKRACGVSSDGGAASLPGMSILAIILIAQASATIPLSPPPVETLRVMPPPVAPPPPIRPDSKVPMPPIPRGNPGNWATSNDYPTTALRNGIEGNTAFRVKVDVTGKVEECEVTESSGSGDLDATTCDLIMRRARFIPAQDGKGNFIAGTWSSRVRWQIPESPVPNDPFRGPDGRFKPTTITYSFFVERDGSTSDCVVSLDDMTETAPMPVGACVPPVPYAPFLDAKGEPVRRRVTVSIIAAIAEQAD